MMSVTFWEKLVLFIVFNALLPVESRISLKVNSSGSIGAISEFFIDLSSHPTKGIIGIVPRNFLLTNESYIMNHSLQLKSLFVIGDIKLAKIKSSNCLYRKQLTLDVFNAN